MGYQVIETADPINFSALDALKSVLGQDFPDLIREFNHHSTDSLIKLEIAVAQLDRTAIQTLSHSLKGAALSLHAKPLADSCGVLELMAGSADDLSLDKRVRQIHTDVKDVLVALEDWAYQ